MTSLDVQNMVGVRFSDIESRIEQLEIVGTQLDEKVTKLAELVKTVLTNATIKSRIVGETPSNMTPFASRLQPVQPANGQATAGGAK